MGTVLFDNFLKLHSKCMPKVVKKKSPLTQQAIENLQKEYTILIIAHRLSTVRNSDRILMLSEGKIIAEGNHSKLIKECKKYRDLYENEIIKEV